MKQLDIEKTLLENAQIANTQARIAEQHTDILLQLTNSYFELLEKVGQQKRVISAQGSLINQCMERIMQLEGRSILGSFNQRIEQLEANKNTFYSIHEKQLPKMMEQLIKRVDDLESWLYTHDFAYFQQEEEMHNREVAYHEQAGNSSFEEYEMHHPDPSYVENDPFAEIGTHPPNCRCPYCEPQETLENMNETL